MENYSYSSYPDSVNSSPRSRDIDPESSSWVDEPNPTQPNHKVKFMCSYGGKILPRPHDNQLTYVGGDTKILSVDRTVRFSRFTSKLSALCGGADVCFKYQLPDEDLDALISVTADEDLEHMMLEYDRLCKASAKPARLRLFLFPLSSPATTAFGSGESKSERQWFVDALNSVQIQNLEAAGGSPLARVRALKDPVVANPDFLFGLEKGQTPPVAAAELQDQPPPPPPVSAYDYGTEEPVVSPAEIQRQIQDFQRMQISNQEQANASPRFYAGEFYQQSAPPPSGMPVTTPASYWSESRVTGGALSSGAPPTDQQMYVISTPAGVYQAPMMRPVGQQQYGIQQRLPLEVYREQALYNAVRQPQPSVQQGYAQVGYDVTGRQVYYTVPGGVLQPPSPLHHLAASGGDTRQGGGAYNLNHEGKLK